YRREHFLVVDRGVGRVRSRERNTCPAQDGDAPCCCADEHGTSGKEALPTRYATIARPILGLGLAGHAATGSAPAASGILPGPTRITRRDFPHGRFHDPHGP